MPSSQQAAARARALFGAFAARGGGDYKCKRRRRVLVYRVLVYSTSAQVKLTGARRLSWWPVLLVLLGAPWPAGCLRPLPHMPGPKFRSPPPLSYM